MKRSKYGVRTPESGVLRACLDLLAAEKIWHERRNTGALRNGKRFVKFSRNGTADIMATPTIKMDQEVDEDSFHFPMPFTLRIVCQTTLWIECKSDSGVQSQQQKHFQSEVEAAGHKYLLVRDVDTLKNWLIEHGVIRK